ncbi:MAG: class I SAM-dependent methyltransferase [Deltaproteobacteria bacterium]
MNEEQKTRWNGVAGQAWVELQELLDRILEPMEKLLAEAIAAGSACQVLDVGCGTGGTTVAAARRLGKGGQALGVDISEPMIDAARARAQQAGSVASFVCADAQRYAFDAASFDLILSRFGVMFFDDTAQAMSNLRRAASSGAELRLLAWRSPEDNPFMTTAERAAAPLLPSLPERRPGTADQFAFADAERVRRLLEGSGWLDIDVRPVDLPCTFPESELTLYLTRLGPLGRVLPDVEEPTRGRIIETVRDAFQPYVHCAEVRFMAACWLFAARAPKEVVRRRGSA